MADYILELKIKEAYISTALEYLPKALQLPEGSTPAEIIDAARQECYKRLRRLYVIGAAQSKYVEAVNIEETTIIEAEVAIRD